VIFPTSHCEMSVLEELCFCLKFCWKLYSTTTNRYEMLHQAFGETALNQQKTFDWKMPSSPWSPKVKQIWSKILPMFIIFTICRTFLECLGRCNLLKSLTNGFRGTCFLHLDNVPCSVALNVTEFLAKHGIPVVPHLPYSPHWAPCHFCLCPRLKITLKRKLQDTMEIQLNTYDSCTEK